MQYVREHEKNLRLQFSHLDKNKDGEKVICVTKIQQLNTMCFTGKVDLEEMIVAFKVSNCSCRASRYNINHIITSEYRSWESK